MASEITLTDVIDEQAIGDADRAIKRWTWIGVGIVLASFGLTVVWSLLAPLSSAVIASGLVKVDTSRKKVQHQEGGVIKEILVKDGEQVRAGQVLVRLDETRAGASHGILQTQYYAAIAQQARLIAERDRLARIQWPAELISLQADPKVKDALRAQEAIFEARRASLQGQLSILDKQISSKKSEIEGLVGQQTSKEEQLKSHRNDLEALAFLLEKGMVEKTKYRAIERDLARLEGERLAHVSAISAARASIGEKDLQKFQIQKAFHEEVSAEMRKVQTEALDFLERKGASQYVLEQTELRAPVDGTVVDLKVHTKGGVIGGGEVLLEIVPSNDQLIVESRVRPEDIDRVRLGLEAAVKLSAFDQGTLPELIGKVTYVSADSISDPKLGITFYLIKVEVPESELVKLKRQTIQPGMLADVFVRTGERTFIDYLLQPITASFGKAWRER